MNRHVLVGLLLLTSVVPLLAQEMRPNEADINQILQRWVERRNGSAGIVVGVVDRLGPKFYAAGKFDTGSSNLVGPDTVFEIGSVSKAFTGMLLAQAAMRQDVHLDDPATKYLPAKVKMPSRDGKQITLRQLVTHTSGLPRMPGNFRPKDPMNPYADYTVEQMYEFLGKCELNAAPGEKFEYSNLGAGLLGHILALRAGTNYEALVVRDIITPLRMSNTCITLTADMRKNLAPGHNAKGAVVKNWDLPTLAGAGALRSTARDMIKLLTASVGIITTPLQPSLDKSQETLHEVDSTKAIAFGWHIRSDWGTRYVWHNGATGGYHAFAGFDQKSRRAVVVLCNAESDIDDIGWNILHVQQVAKIDPKIYDNYVGTYEFPGGGDFVITRSGDRLLAKLGNQPALEIFPGSETNFFPVVVDAQLTFVKGADGKATTLILHQGGIDQKAQRKKE